MITLFDAFAGWLVNSPSSGGYILDATEQQNESVHNRPEPEKLDTVYQGNVYLKYIPNYDKLSGPWIDYRLINSKGDTLPGTQTKYTDKANGSPFN